MTDTADAQNPLAGVLSADQVDALVNAAEDLGEGRHGVEELLADDPGGAGEGAGDRDERSPGLRGRRPCWRRHGQLPQRQDH